MFNIDNNIIISIASDSLHDRQNLIIIMKLTHKTNFNFRVSRAFNLNKYYTHILTICYTDIHLSIQQAYENV